MREKKTDDPIEGLLEELRTDISHDRDRLSGVLDKLIRAAGEDPDRIIVVAETVAKIGDSLTKQNHLRVDALKALAKRNLRPDDDDDLDPFSDIGGPFDSRGREN